MHSTKILGYIINQNPSQLQENTELSFWKQTVTVRLNMVSAESKKSSHYTMTAYCADPQRQHY